MSPIIIASIIMILTFFCFFHPRIPNVAVAIASALAFGLTGIIPMDTVFNGFAGPSPILMIGMMTIGGAVFQSGLAGWIGQKIIKVTGTNLKTIQMVILLMSTFLTMFVGASGTLMIIYALMASIAISSKISMSKLVAFEMSGSLSGSMLTFTGCGMIGASAAILQASGYRMWSFFEVAWYGLPRLVIVFLISYFFANKVLPDNFVMPDESMINKDSLQEKLTPKMIISGLIFLLTIAGFIANSSSLPVHVVATLGALACLFTGCLTPKQMYSAISWDVILLIGGMSGFGKGMQASGFGELIGQFVMRLTGADPSPILVIFILIIATGIITQFMSDNAAIGLMAPIAIGLAKTMGIEPYAFVMATLVASSLCHLSIMASPPLAFIMDIGGYKPTFFLKWGLMIEFLPALCAAMIMIPLIWL